MEKHVLVLASSNNTLGGTLVRVLDLVIRRPVRLIPILQNRWGTLLEELKHLEDAGGDRIILGNEGDGRWESLLGLLLSRRGGEVRYRVLLCSVDLDKTIAERLKIHSVPEPLDLVSVLSWLASEDLPANSKADIDAVESFVGINWHNLKYDLFWLSERPDPARAFFRFLDLYASSDSLRIILGDAGTNVYELGRQFKLQSANGNPSFATMAEWRAYFSDLIKAFDLLHALSPRR